MNCLCVGDFDCLHQATVVDAAPEVYSTMPNVLLELKTRNQLSISNFRNGFYNEDAELYNGSVGGSFSVKRENDMNTLLFRGSTMKNMNILFAVLSQGVWRLIFRVITTKEKVFALKIKAGMFLRSGVTVPAEFSQNTSLIVCLKYDEEFNIDVMVKMFGSEYGIIHWDLTSFTMTDSLVLRGDFEITNINRYRRCEECLVIALDGQNHLPPCPPQNTRSIMRSDIYCRQLMRLLQIRFDNPKNKIQVLNNDSGAFVDVTQDTVFNNEIIEGMFTFKVLDNGRTVLTFDSISMNRFAILFAVLVKNVWRVRFCLVMTTIDGALCFQVTKRLFANNDRFEVPQNWKNNCVLFFGIRPNNEDVNITLRVHACNPYEAKISWKHLRDECSFSDDLKPSKA